MDTAVISQRNSSACSCISFMQLLLSLKPQAPTYLSTLHRDWVLNETILGSQGDRKWWLHFQGRGSEEEIKDAPVWPQ